LPILPAKQIDTEKDQTYVSNEDLNRAGEF
jgi:hypothetical protein